MSAPARGRVETAVRIVTMELGGVRAAQAFLWGLSGLFATHAAAVASGASASAPGTWSVSAVGALIAGACWWCAHRAGADQVARAVDQHLELEGAFVTTWELGARREPAPESVAALLRRRVEARLPRRLSTWFPVQLLLPGSAFPIAAPFLAFFVLAAVLEHTREEARPASAGRLADGLAARLDLVGDVAGEAVAEGELDLATYQRLADLEERASRVARELGAAKGEAGETEELAERLRALDRDLARTATELPPEASQVGDGGLRRALDDARGWADAALAELDRRSDPGPSSERGPGSGSGADAENGDLAAESGAGGALTAGSEGRPGVTGGGGDGADGGARLTSAVGEGTMSSSPSPERVPESAPRERGTTGGAWWAAEYDPVVERWIERVADPR